MNETNDILAFVKIANKARSDERRRAQKDVYDSMIEEYISDQSAADKRLEGFKRTNKVVQSVVYGVGALAFTIAMLATGALFVLCC